MQILASCSESLLLVGGSHNNAGHDNLAIVKYQFVFLQLLQIHVYDA